MNLIQYVSGYAPEFIDNDCSDDMSYIDIAIEFNIKLFDGLGLSSQRDKDGYIQNELGVFYSQDGEMSWFWAITNKSTKSRNFDKVGDFYLTDSETGSRISARPKIWREFKKAITPKLNKALKKFAKEEGLI